MIIEYDDRAMIVLRKLVIVIKWSNNYSPPSILTFYEVLNGKGDEGVGVVREIQDGKYETQDLFDDDSFEIIINDYKFYYGDRENYLFEYKIYDIE